MPPDLITFVLDDGESITNAKLREGIKVSVVVAKVLDIWRTPRRLEVSKSRRFSFDYDYVSVEELVKGYGI